MHFSSSFDNVSNVRTYNESLFMINTKDRKLYQLNADNTLLKITEEKVDSFIFYFNALFFQSENAIYKLDPQKQLVLKGSHNEIIGLQQYLFNDQIVVSSTPVNDWMPNASYLIDSSLQYQKLNFAFRYDLNVGAIYANFNQNELITFSKTHEQLKKIEASKFSRNIAHHPKTGEVLWDKPNEIHERPIGDNEKIYVPLTGGQLVALYAESGEKAWLWEHHRTGTYQILGEYIYKQDGLSIFEIKTSDGTLNREKKFNDDPMVEGFHASGPLWVYEDVIIVCDVLYGKICMMDRSTLDVIEFFSLEKKLINSENAIAWHQEKLYVLDIDNTLHIFERE